MTSAFKPQNRLQIESLVLFSNFLGSFFFLFMDNARIQHITWTRTGRLHKTLNEFSNS